MPFAGGVVGYLGYEAGRWCEKMPSPKGPRPLADLALWRVDGALWWNGQSWSAGGTPSFVEAASEVLECACEAPPLQVPRGQLAQVGDPAGFLQGVERVLAAIRAGDCYQANLSRRLVVDRAGSPLECAFRLRRNHPARYGATLDLGEAGQVVSNSPELLLQVENGRVETRPVKGTRPRGTSAELDRLLARQLMEDPKEQAELTMIVDMARNDLSRVCTPGSVVTSQRALASLPTLFHAEQSVQGQLAPGQDAVSALEATFPGASITGAPKVAAMEIIHALEPVPRGVYTGSIGFFGDGGSAQWNVAIRTATFLGSRSGEQSAHVQVGAGIVADSKPRTELDETDWKARAWLTALLEPQSQAPEVHP